MGKQELVMILEAAKEMLPVKVNSLPVNSKQHILKTKEMLPEETIQDQLRPLLLPKKKKEESSLSRPATLRTESRPAALADQ